jgi:SAM-dependent methyltransferase
MRFSASAPHSMTTVGRAPMRLSPVQHNYREALLGKLSTGVYEYERAGTCLCGSTSSVQLATRDRFGIPVGTVLCRSCGLCRTDPRLATKDLPSFYNEIYHGLHQGIAEPDPSSVLFRIGQGEVIHRYLHGLLPDGDLRVAEIGCGTGNVLREFQAAATGRAVTVAGCEYAEAFVTVGREAGTDVRLGGPEALQASAPFDVVVMSHVAEHFPDPVEALTGIAELGHRDTLYYVEVPGMMTIHRKPEYGYRFDRYLTLAHTFHFTLATLAATMARAGFEMVRGDEEVRSVFKAGTRGVPAANPDTASHVLDYLKWLDRSWRMRAVRVRHEARPVVGRMLRRVLGGRLYSMLRRRA